MKFGVKAQTDGPVTVLLVKFGPDRRMGVHTSL